MCPTTSLIPTRADQSRAVQTRPDQTRPDQVVYLANRSEQTHHSREKMHPTIIALESTKRMRIAKASIILIEFLLIFDIGSYWYWYHGLLPSSRYFHRLSTLIISSIIFIKASQWRTWTIITSQQSIWGSRNQCYYPLTKLRWLISISELTTPASTVV